MSQQVFSRAIVHAYTTVQQTAPAEIPLIIVGESGTGKDLLAHSIHMNSARARGPFVKLVCDSKSEALIKRELLGHAAGAFPGTPQSHAGRVELADTGTLYLDRLCKFPDPYAERLLETLLSGRTQRVGETRTLAADLRLVVSVDIASPPTRPAQQFLHRLERELDAVTIEIPPPA